MESNITDQQFWSSDSPLATPHFDEEATLLAAQPVVPIKELSVKPPGRSRPWVFGLALTGALLLGVSATAIYYSRSHTTASQPVNYIETVTSGAQGMASDAFALDELVTQPTGASRAGSSSVDSDTPFRVKAMTPSDSWATRPLNASNAVSTKPVHRRARVEQDSETEEETRERRGAKRIVVDPSSEAEDETAEERRGAKRELKEQRRANRERRAPKHSNELLRIRDIFEGPPRP